MRAGHIVYKSFGDDIGDKRWSIFREEEHSEKLENPNIFEPMPINDLWLSKMVAFHKFREDGHYEEYETNKNISIAFHRHHVDNILTWVVYLEYKIEYELVMFL